MERARKTPVSSNAPVCTTVYAGAREVGYRQNQGGAREADIEFAMVQTVKRLGGLTLKLVSPGLAGVPDRIVLGTGGRIAFVEVKAPGCKPTALQERRHAQLRDLGFEVYVVAGRGEARAAAELVCR